MVHAFNPSTQETGRQMSVSSRPAWSTERVPGQPRELHRETLSQKTKQKGRKGRKKEEGTKEKEGGKKK